MQTQYSKGARDQGNSVTRQISGHYPVQSGPASAGGRDPRTYQIIGAAMAVHGELGQGFLEPEYQSALAVELSSRNVPFRREAEIPIRYKATVLDVFYRPDYICFDEVVVDLKALPSIGGVEESQTINYLKATGLKTGLLLNFGSGSVQYKRFVS